MEQPESPSPASEMAKHQTEADIERFKGVVEHASVEDVDTPTGRKDVTIIYQSSDGYEIEEGVAVGVYFEPDRASPERVHIDWLSQTSKASDNYPQDRTTVEWSDIEILDEGEYRKT